MAWTQLPNGQWIQVGNSGQQRSVQQLQLPGGAQNAARRATRNGNGNGNWSPFDALPGGDQLKERYRDANKGISKKELREELDKMRKDILGRVDQRLLRSEGGRMVAPDRNEYATYQREGGKTGKGGVVVSDTVDFGSDIAVGTTASAEFSGDELSRMTGEVVCAITGLLTDDMAADAEKVMISLTLNGDTLPEFSRIPLDYIARTSDGEIQRVPIGYRVPFDSVLGIQAKIITELSSDANDNSFRLRAETASECY